MDCFTINRTEFGIDRDKSSVAFERTRAGGFAIDIVVHGDPLQYAKLANATAWSWSLYPPTFYLRAFPVPNSRDFAVHLDIEDYEEYDTALYMIEHNSIDAVVVEVSGGSKVHVSGKVELSGGKVDFTICWERAVGDR